MSLDLHPSSIRNFAILTFCLFLEERINTVNFVETRFARGTHSGLETQVGYMLWFNVILGLNLIFLCFKLRIIIHNYTPKQRKLNLNQG